MENDQSRDALSNRTALKASGYFAVGPPAAYTLRRSMMRTDVLHALRIILIEIAKYVYYLERWFVIDATYFTTRYYLKIAQTTSRREKIWRKIKSAKVFIVRGLKTGVPVATMVTDDNFNDQRAFPILFKQMMAAGAIIRGGGLIGDAGFNKAAHFELVRKHGGSAFFDFDSDAVYSNGRFPHYDEQLRLWRKDRDQYSATYNWRPLIEATNHAIKTLFKRSFRAKFEVPRDIEATALIIVYALSRFLELRLKYKIELPFADERATATLDDAIRPKRSRRNRTRASCKPQTCSPGNRD